MSFLLTQFGVSGHDIADAKSLPPDLAKYFLINVLNETPGSTADQIVAACDSMASILVGASVIATDRQIRRNLDGEERWQFAMPLPASETEVARHVDLKSVAGSIQPLLSLPFFLDRAIQGELKQSSLATIEAFLANHGKLSDDELRTSAEAAYNAYPNALNSDIPTSQNLIPTASSTLLARLGSWHRGLGC